MRYRNVEVRVRQKDVSINISLTQLSPGLGSECDDAEPGYRNARLEDTRTTVAENGYEQDESRPLVRCIVNRAWGGVCQSQLRVKVRLVDDVVRTPL